MSDLFPDAPIGEQEFRRLTLQYETDKTRAKRSRQRAARISRRRRERCQRLGGSDVACQLLIEGDSNGESQEQRITTVGAMH